MPDIEHHIQSLCHHSTLLMTSQPLYMKAHPVCRATYTLDMRHHSHSQCPHTQSIWKIVYSTLFSSFIEGFVLSIHFSVSLLWLIFCVYFYVSGRSIIFFHPGDVAFGGSCSMSPAVSSPLIIIAIRSSIYSFVGFLPPSAVQVLTTVGALVGRAGPYPLAVRPCLV